MTGRRRAVRSLALGVGSLVAVTGCGIPGLQSYQLPGGSAGGDAYEVVIIFDDVTSLERQASVRVADVPVGDIHKLDVCEVGSETCRDDVGRSGFRAKVTVRIKKDVVLPDNAVAVVKQTSLLGEKFVEIGPPRDEAPQGELARQAAPGVEYPAIIPADETREEPDLEEVFGALSLLLNGGGVEQLQTIATELSSALTGREVEVRDLLRQLNRFVGGLDDNKSEIVRALDSLDRFSATLVEQRTTIATALTDIAPGLRVLADNEPDLTSLLQALSRLGDVATRVIRKTKADTVASFESLRPVLQQLAAAGSYLPRALEVLLDYPFPKNATNGIFGDYTGLLADINLQASIGNLISDLELPVSQNGTAAGARDNGSRRAGAEEPAARIPLLPGLPLLPDDGSDLPGVDDRLGTGGQQDNGLLLLLMGGLR